MFVWAVKWSKECDRGVLFYPSQCNLQLTEIICLYHVSAPLYPLQDFKALYKYCIIIIIIINPAEALCKDSRRKTFWESVMMQKIDRFTWTERVEYAASTAVRRTVLWELSSRWRVAAAAGQAI